MILKPLFASLRHAILAVQLRMQQKLAAWGIREQTLLVALSFLVGAASGAATWLFEKCLWLMATYYYQPMVEFTQAAVLPSHYFLLPLIPAFGAVVMVLWRRLWRRDSVRLHGLAGILYSLTRKSGKLHPGLGVETLVASSLTIGSGGSAGPEAPIAVIGSSIGSLIAGIFGLSRRNLPVLVGCGAAAGISAVFGAPIAGVLFAMEVLLRDFSVRTLTPIVISSVISTTMYVWLSGGGAVRGLFQMPAQGAQTFVFTFHLMPYYLLLGIICGLLAVLFTRLYVMVEDAAEAISKRLGEFWLPALGAIFSGLCGIVVLMLFFKDGFMQSQFAQGQIPIFGTGYPTIQSIINPVWYSRPGFAGPHVTLLLLEFLIALCGLKIAATIFTLSSGGSGGVFAPALFIGATGGGVVGEVIRSYRPGIDPSTFALVGMGAVLAAVIQAPLTSIILLFELTRNYAVMLPIMLAAVTATLIQQILVGESIYTLPLKHMGVHLGAAVGISALQRIGVDQLALVGVPTAHPSEPLSNILARSRDDGTDIFVVVDSGGKYLGILTIDDLKTVMLEPMAAPLLLVGEVLRTDIPPLKLHDTLDVALAMFTRHEVSHLAVMDHAPARHQPHPVKGLLSRAELMRRYYQELSG
ncbi:MAG TPA: chloride channel protein [Phycisphaerae bacterium]|nr:chloride channel protein [Phycisphaerae bacterium]